MKSVIFRIVLLYLKFITMKLEKKEKLKRILQIVVDILSFGLTKFFKK